MKSDYNLNFLFFYFILFFFFIGCKSDVKNKETSSQIDKDTYVRGEMEVQRGMEIFNRHCASCHNFMATEIGPNLSGVTSEVSKDWLTAFINDPKTMIESGDERAARLYEKYKLYMPSFPTIKDADLENLLGFIHKFSEAEKKSQNARPGGMLNPIPAKIPTSYLTLVIEEWLVIPSSSDVTPLARINKMQALKTGTGERMFIADLRGKLYEIVNDTVEVYLDLNEKVENFMDNPGWGTGLGSFNFHPDFNTNGLFYTTHTEPAKTSSADFPLPDSVKVGLQWVLTEWKTKTPDTKKFSGEKRELLRVDMVTAAHGFQELTFNPTAQRGEADFGLLYLGMGDGASALRGYPELCDNPGQLWGSILRIDPKGNNSENGMYGIPQDNPYANDSMKLGEIWASGFRNAHRISWNMNKPHQMFVSNIGQHSVEEVNLVQKGADYGWPNREGTFLYDVDANTEVVYPLPDDDDGYSYPLIQYDHDEGNAVSGGFAYSGEKIPLLKNKYIFGDILRATLFFSDISEIKENQQLPIFRIGLELNGKATNFVEITQNERVELRFGIDSAGELLLFTKSDGKVYRVIGCHKVTEKMNL